MNRKESICNSCSRYDSECICSEPTLRDWLAAFALAGLQFTRTNSFVSDDEIIAQRAYEIADAMLKERKAE